MCVETWEREVHTMHAVAIANGISADVNITLGMTVAMTIGSWSSTIANRSVAIADGARTISTRS